MPSPRPDPKPATYAFFFGAFALILLALHEPCLTLPYFWDEMGQFVPAALDILRDNAWIPHSTLPNVHPPGVMAYLALVWSAVGYSVLATRVAMLAVAAAGLVGVFLLSIELCRGLRGTPAFAPVLLLFASPLFYTQAMMAQLDMPAMVLTVFALLLFLQNRIAWCAVVCVALVLVKETGVLAPALFAFFLVREKRWKEAAAFVPSVIALAIWLVVLKQHTGQLFGNREFTQYNVWFPLHPARLSTSLFRRFFYVFADNLHVIGTIAIVLAWRRTDVFRNRAWAIAASFGILHILMVSVLGGAGLERYLLPALPVFYIAVGAAWTTLPKTQARWSQVAMLAGLIGGLFWNPPWPFPFENNLAAVDFVRLQKEAAVFVEERYSGKVIASAWPFPDSLRRPEFGYVSHPLQVKGLEDFHRSSVLALQSDPPPVLVVYSRTWEPKWGILQSEAILNFLKTYYLYEPQITDGEIYTSLGLLPVARWERRGQWIEVLAKPDANVPVLVQWRKPSASNW